MIAKEATMKMTLNEVAEYLRVHRNTITAMVEKEGLKAYKLGSKWVFEKEEVDEWLKTRLVK